MDQNAVVSMINSISRISHREREKSEFN